MTLAMDMEEIARKKKYYLGELNQFYGQLKRYEEILPSREESESEKGLLPAGEKQELDILRENIVRKEGELEPIVSSLTRTHRLDYPRGSSIDIWATGLSRSWLPFREICLSDVKDQVNGAIGALQALATPGPTAEQLTSFVYWGKLMWQKTWRPVWAWVKTHKMFSVGLSVALIIITFIIKLLETNWAVVMQNVRTILSKIGGG